MRMAQAADAGEAWDARRGLAPAVAAAGPDLLSAWLDRHPLRKEDVLWLGHQGLAQLGYYRMQQGSLLDRLPVEVAAPWEDSYQQHTLRAAGVDWEIEQILQALASAGVAFIWMKGAALAHTVYPSPACRGRGDLDLWIQPEQLPLATSVLKGLGYRPGSKEHRPDALALLVGGELPLVKTGAALELIELQWPAIRGEWVRHTTAVDHAGIWQRRMPVSLWGQTFAVMAHEDALIHLCVHQAINHQFGTPWLRNLMDIHLLLAAYPLDWGRVIERATEWRLATTVWTVLHLAQQLLGTVVPETVNRSLAPTRWRRWWISRLRLEQALLTMQSGGYDHRRFLVQVLLVDRLRDGVRLLARGLFPDRVWLQVRYGVAPGQSLWRLRLVHMWRLATSARV